MPKTTFHVGLAGNGAEGEIRVLRGVPLEYHWKLNTGTAYFDVRR